VPVPATTFRLLIVPGVTVAKWSRMWSERRPGVELRLVPASAAEAPALLPTEADAGLLRLPVSQETFSAIPLYTEATVAVIPKDHGLAESEELTLADLADETWVQPADDVLTWTSVPESEFPDRPATTAAAVELVAAGAGIVVVPQSLARAHHRRDLVYRVVTDAPASSVALVWGRDRHTELVEEMIGIVRGRTANSTRGVTPPPAAKAARAATRPSAPRSTPTGRGNARRGSDPPRRRRGR
jgi:DNA-binding transcriptional LysR family regulator